MISITKSLFYTNAGMAGFFVQMTFSHLVGKLPRLKSFVAVQ